MEEPETKTKIYCLALFIFLILLLVGISFAVKKLYFDKNVENICTSEIASNINIEIYQEPSGDFSWWNNDYPYYRQITLSNSNNTKLPKECYISLEIDHGYLVDDKKSRGDAYDISLVHYSDGEYTEIPFYISSPDTGSTTIQFLPQEDLMRDSSDNGYFLYYGNLGSSKNEHIFTEYEEKVSYAQKYTLLFTKEIQKDITGRINRLWILKGGTFEEEYSKLTYTVSINDSLISYSTVPKYEVLGTSLNGNLSQNKAGEYEVKIDTDDLGVGTYEILSSVKVAGKSILSSKSYFIVSYPLYVTFTIDYEGVDVPDSQFEELVSFSQRHNDLPIVHFFNPRIYVTEDVSSERVDKITTWITDREKMNDEIGMHLHMHYDMIEEIGLEPKTSPKWTTHLNNGHDVPCSAYDYDEFKEILNWAIKVYGEKGLGLPISFRAGGWFADSDVLRAVSDSGFRIDSSGRNHYLWGANNLVGHWNLQPTTHPYHPSISNQNSDSPPPNLVLWEYPNNGGDSYFYDHIELINRFNMNFDGNPLDQSQTITYLSHPHDFTGDLITLEPTFDHIDKYLASRDRGPVIYITFRNILSTSYE